MSGFSRGKVHPEILPPEFQLSHSTIQFQGCRSPATQRAASPGNTHPAQSLPCLSSQIAGDLARAVTGTKNYANRVQSHHKEEILSRPQFLSSRPMRYTAAQLPGLHGKQSLPIPHPIDPQCFLLRWQAGNESHQPNPTA